MIPIRVESLIRSANVPPVVAQLLVARGVYHAEDAKLFLDNKLVGLRDRWNCRASPKQLN